MLFEKVPPDEFRPRRWVERAKIISGDNPDDLNNELQHMFDDPYIVIKGFGNLVDTATHWPNRDIMVRRISMRVDYQLSVLPDES